MARAYLHSSIVAMDVLGLEGAIVEVDKLLGSLLLFRAMGHTASNVIASPSPFVILTLNEVKGKNLNIRLRINSAKQSHCHRHRLLRR